MLDQPPGTPDTVWHPHPQDSCDRGPQTLHIPVHNPSQPLDSTISSRVSATSSHVSVETRPQVQQLLRKFVGLDPTASANKTAFRDSCPLIHSFIKAITLDHNPMVLNYSSHVLTTDQLSTLERGLKFCPTPGEPDMGTLASDLHRFHNNLRSTSWTRSPTVPP